MGVVKSFVGCVLNAPKLMQKTRYLMFMLLYNDLKLNSNVEKNTCCEADPGGIAGALRTHPTRDLVE